MEKIYYVSHNDNKYVMQIYLYFHTRQYNICLVKPVNTVPLAIIKVTRILIQSDSMNLVLYTKHSIGVKHALSHADLLESALFSSNYNKSRIKMHNI